MIYWDDKDIYYDALSFSLLLLRRRDIIRHCRRHDHAIMRDMRHIQIYIYATLSVFLFRPSWCHAAAAAIRPFIYMIYYFPLSFFSTLRRVSPFVTLIYDDKILLILSSPREHMRRYDTPSSAMPAYFSHCTNIRDIRLDIYFTSGEAGKEAGRAAVAIPSFSIFRLRHIYIQLKRLRRDSVIFSFLATAIFTLRHCFW